MVKTFNQYFVGIELVELANIVTKMLFPIKMDQATIPNLVHRAIYRVNCGDPVPPQGSILIFLNSFHKPLSRA